MRFSGRYPSQTRQAVETLLRGSDLTMLAIARRTGVSYATVKLWNRKACIRPWSRIARLAPDPRMWTAGRVRAVARLFQREGLDPGDVAEALGARRAEAPALMMACGAAAAEPPVDEPTGEAAGGAPSLSALDAALRAHIGRQIAAFDRRLNDTDPTADGARVLRDLGGLRRLLDDLSAAAEERARDGDADGGPPQDLAALRDRIARRYEAFEAEGRHPRVPGAADAGGAGAARA